MTFLPPHSPENYCPNQKKKRKKKEIISLIEIKMQPIKIGIFFIIVLQKFS